KAIREAGGNVKALAVRRNRETRRNLLLAARGIGWGQRNGAESGEPMVRPDREDFYAALDIGEIEPRAVRRKNEAGVAGLLALIRLQDVARAFFVGIRQRAVIGQRELL